MIKPFIYIFFVITFVLEKLNAQQNLVINGSFEDTLSTNFTINYPLCQYWYNPNASTSDYYSPFCNALNWGTGYCTPTGFLGYQQAQHGVAYVGMVLYEPGNPTKEYAQGELIQPLIAGKKYQISFYINRADSSNYTICEIEIGFTNSLIHTLTNSGSLMLTDTVKFYIDDVDTLNWSKKERIYTAQGGEKYIYIGNNTPNTNLSCASYLQGNFPQAGYYIVDNVSVAEISDNIFDTTHSSIILIPNIFTPNGDGINDIWMVDLNNYKNVYCKIFNRWGALVYECTNNSIRWDGKNSSGKEVSNGVYYYYISYLTHENKEESITGFIQLFN